MGLFTIPCPNCKQSHVRFSGSIDQRCNDCKLAERNKKMAQRGFRGVLVSTKKKPVLAYHFVGERLRDGKPIPANGRWISRKDISMCNYGLHASLHPFDALKYAPGETLCLVEMGGKIEYGDDKLVAQKRKIVARFDATELLYDQARKSALSVIGNWKTPVPQVVIDYLNTGRADLRSAAESAARSAVRSAVRSAAGSAARSAARSAAGSAARSAAESAAWSAARSAAESAAESAAWSAAWSAAGSAARSAAWSAAWSAAESAAWSAAGSAAESAAGERLLTAVVDKFKACLSG